MKAKQRPAIFVVSSIPKIQTGSCDKALASFKGEQIVIRMYGAKRLPVFEQHTLLEFRQWGDSEWLSLREGFIGQQRDFYKAQDVPNLSKCTSVSRLFLECTNFNQDVSKWDTSNIEDMSWAFTYCVKFNQDLSKWNTSSVVNMSGMFAVCTSFDQDISKWDTSSVTDMSWMFSGCTIFNQDVSKWDTSSVRDMSWMFRDCSKFNQDVSKWDVSMAKSISCMLYGCVNYKHQVPILKL